ncbi:hypothetical protein THAOC_07784 [Thalassiosira oceanica]|uniref:Uncharacterized protein n=1 Tax=Thalassiosira oceanica TaxID=159749 RepID=K0SWP8_THAOC|nr:hypothetical protein THAOC_07784 [Thalassiosira oceanica]|eukprot:EJK70828.1 hypothetical protein THAOC_07784 [Thalassiosira oceanica]
MPEAIGGAPGEAYDYLLLGGGLSLLGGTMFTDCNDGAAIVLRDFEFFEVVVNLICYEAADIPYDLPFCYEAADYSTPSPHYSTPFPTPSPAAYSTPFPTPSPAAYSTPFPTPSPNSTPFPTPFGSTPFPTPYFDLRRGRRHLSRHLEKKAKKVAQNFHKALQQKDEHGRRLTSIEVIVGIILLVIGLVST